MRRHLPSEFIFESVSLVEMSAEEAEQDSASSE